MIASDKAIQAMITSDKAIQAMIASDKALQAMIASDKALQAMIANNTTLQKNAKILYNTISTSGKWKKTTATTTYGTITFSGSKKSIIFINAGGYYSTATTTRVFHPGNTIAGDGSLASLSSAHALDVNNLIVTFVGGYTKPLSSSAACVYYEIWTLKE